MEFLKCSQQICPHRGLTPFPSLLFTAPAGKTLVLRRSHVPHMIGIFGHLSRKAAAFPACSCPHAGSKPSISLPTASMACQIHAFPLSSDAFLLFHLSTHPPVRFHCYQPLPGLKTDKLSSYFSSLPPPQRKQSCCQARGTC